MDDDQARRYLDSLGTDVLERPAPVADLVAGGRRAARRRRRRTAVLGAAVALVLLVGSAVVVEVLAVPEPRELPVAAIDPVDPVSAEPIAPPGTRLVGLGRVVVAVPDDWPTDATTCGLPVVDTVYFPQDVIYRCGVRVDPRAVTSVAIVAADSGQGRTLLRGLRLTGEPRTVAGLDVIVGSTCPPTAACIYPWGQIVNVPEAGVLIRVTGPDRSPFYDELVSSVRLLPDGRTTVPSAGESYGVAPAAAVVRRAGFAVEIDPRLRGRRTDDFHLEPGVGEPIEEGGLVRVLPGR